MRQLIRILTGVTLGLMPLGAAAIIGIATYATLPNTIGLIIVGMIGLLAIWAGYKVFIRVQEAGILRTMSYYQASPDMDNLKPINKRKANR